MGRDIADTVFCAFFVVFFLWEDFGFCWIMVCGCVYVMIEMHGVLEGMCGEDLSAGGEDVEFMGRAGDCTEFSDFCLYKKKKKKKKRRKPHFLPCVCGWPTGLPLGGAGCPPYKGCPPNWGTEVGDTVGS